MSDSTTKNWLARLFNKRPDTATPPQPEPFQPAPSPQDRDDWTIVNLSNEEKGDAIIRVRMGKPVISGIDNYTTAIEIIWRYDVAGMPSEEVHLKQVALEHALDGLMRGNGLSELVQVSTGLGVKEWLIYANDRQKFMDAFNQALAGHERYPIKIELFDDPDWKLWQGTVDAIRGRGV